MLCLYIPGHSLPIIFGSLMRILFLLKHAKYPRSAKAACTKLVRSGMLHAGTNEFVIFNTGGH